MLLRGLVPQAPPPCMHYLGRGLKFHLLGIVVIFCDIRPFSTLILLISSDDWMFLVHSTQYCKALSVHVLRPTHVVSPVFMKGDTYTCTCNWCLEDCGAFPAPREAVVYKLACETECGGWVIEWTSLCETFP